MEGLGPFLLRCWPRAARASLHHFKCPFQSRALAFRCQPENGAALRYFISSSSLPILGLPVVSPPPCPSFIRGSLPPALPGVGGGCPAWPAPSCYLGCLRCAFSSLAWVPTSPWHGAWQWLPRGLSSRSCLDPGCGGGGTVRSRILAPAVL